MLRFLVFSFFATTLIISCGDGSGDNNTTPVNLSVVITNADDGTGLVEVAATAENAVSYTMDTGDAGADILNSSDGQFTYTYANTGTYTIVIAALGSTGTAIDKEEVIVVNSGAPAVVGVGYSTPISYFGKDLIWNDEFNGTELNEDFWCFDIGTGCPNLCGWGNNELQYYRSENTRVGDGVLTIEVKRESFSNSAYTSGKIVTRKKQLFQYGRIDIRAQMPKGQGMWPAMWMLGDNQDVVGWPSCGEIDMVEMIGGSGRENEVLGTAFWDNNGVNNFTGKYKLSSGTFSDEYHVFSIIWDETAIRWYVDDQLYHTLDISSQPLAELREQFYMIFNVAVGGNLPGSPDATTVFPSELKIDYVRYFRDN